MHDRPLMRRLQSAERVVEREADVVSQRFGEGEEGVALLFKVRPRGDGALPQRQVRVADQKGGVRALLDAEALAGRAPAQGAVEREVVRVQRLVAAAAGVTS